MKNNIFKSPTTGSLYTIVDRSRSSGDGLFVAFRALGPDTFRIRIQGDNTDLLQAVLEQLPQEKQYAYANRADLHLTGDFHLHRPLCIWAGVKEHDHISVTTDSGHMFEAIEDAMQAIAAVRNR